MRLVYYEWFASIPINLLPCNQDYLELNPLPNNKIFNWFKLKAFADDNLNVTKMMIPLDDRVENIVGKEENAGYKHFLLFPQRF